MENFHILLVEDEPDMREVLAETLQAAGYKVTVAENGAQGYAKAMELKPDLIMADIVMPEMNGHDMLAKIRQDAWGQKVKVIMLTSMDTPKDVAIGYENAVQDYVIKMHNSLDEILAKVQVVLQAES